MVDVQHIVGDVSKADVRECEARTGRARYTDSSSATSDCPQRGT